MTTTGTGRGAVTDGHTGWDCPNGASLLAAVTGPSSGTLPAHHGVIYVCTNHQAQAEARITAAGHQPDTEPAPPGHRWDPWPCGHITTYGPDGPQLAHALTTPADIPDTGKDDVAEDAGASADNPATAGVLDEVAAERVRQDEKLGEQNHIPLGDLAERYSPAHGYATIAVRPDEIELGDVADHTDGMVVVTEITRRHTVWTIGGYNPALPQWLPHADPADLLPRSAHRPLLTRDITAGTRIRVRRPATAWHRLTGHTKQITSHNPVRRGMYTLNDGWNAACSCGWAAPAPHRGRGAAGDAVMRHRAEVLTDLTDRKLGNLATIERLEAELGDVLPWRWDHGAQAQLRGLNTTEALARLTPWAEALGVGIEHMPADAYGLGGEHFLWVDSRPGWDGPALDIRAFPTDTQGA